MVPACLPFLEKLSVPNDFRTRCTYIALKRSDMKKMPHMRLYDKIFSRSDFGVKVFQREIRS